MTHIWGVENVFVWVCARMGCVRLYLCQLDDLVACRVWQCWIIICYLLLHKPHAVPIALNPCRPDGLFVCPEQIHCFNIPSITLPPTHTHAHKNIREPKRDLRGPNEIQFISITATVVGWGVDLKSYSLLSRGVMLLFWVLRLLIFA